jgi:hypothetical protein
MFLVCSFYVEDLPRMSSPSPSRAALAAGVPTRFLYWLGRSGKRHLFTRTSGQGISDFEDGVAIAVRDGKVIWAGDIADLGRMPEHSAPRRATIYLHLLASNAEERQAVTDDLRPDPWWLRLAA